MWSCSAMAKVIADRKAFSSSGLSRMRQTVVVAEILGDIGP
jgi:hypothetical protein